MSREQFRKQFNLMPTIMIDRYPKAFFSCISEKMMPLQIGVHSKIIDENPDLSPDVISVFLNCYTNQTRYLHCISAGLPRINLDGNPVSDMPDEHRHVAKAKLRERSRKYLKNISVQK